MSNSQKRRAENEVIFRMRNNAVKDMAKRLQHNGLSPYAVLQFTCECSNETCRDKVGLTVAEYEAVRGNSRDFIIQPGHEQPDIEKVVKVGYVAVVEKFIEPPRTDGILNKT
ncbi:MAG: hypothetical protein NVS3B29_00580 [Candidatus Saccharimonadales bacterium]